MKFVESDPRGHNNIRGYEAGAVLINEKSYHNSLIVTADRVIDDWPPQTFSALRSEHLTILATLAPEVLLIGTGAAIHFLPPEWAAIFLEKGIGLEVMDTAAACRTYNVLLSEGRNVAAALLMT